MLLFTNTKEMTKRFIRNKWDPKDFLFISISSTVTIDRSFDTKSLPELLPDSSSIQQAIDGNEKASKEGYLARLMHVPYIDATVAVLVKSAAEGKNIVFVCGPMEEDNVDYLKVLRDYIETVYQVDTHTLKDLQKRGFKKLAIKYPDTIIDRVFARIKKHTIKEPNLSNIVDQILNKEKYEEEQEKKRKKRKKKKKRKKRRKKKMAMDNPFI